ncbi:recombination regulator RecX [Streptococcus sciuri]|uniref:Regulatory protein RecX n=1 Tax=Streptococcus sciuri TaxID=2973939 RepID=A0ABT2F6F9_9STRE|nr:recombination regulator RecX [Streptococcus sciuri]MCS4488019.1 recombination regulator RecX [Streptococcus sciuri]
MKITKLEKKKRLYLLELDDTERLYITEDTVVRFFLSKEKVISQDELEHIKDFAQFSYGKNLALHALSFRPRTEKETRDYLLKYKVDEGVITKVINNLKEENWLNDARYANTFIEQRLTSGDKGAYVLQQKLKQKGIHQSIIEEALTDRDFSPVLEKVATKLVKKYQDKLPVNALKTKIKQSLTTKGFSYQEAKKAVDNLDLERDESQEITLIERDLYKLHRKYSRRYDGYELKQRLIQALMRKGYDYADIKCHLRDY